MTANREWQLRLSILSKLVAEAPAKPGRTALMKFAYLLQTVRRVPLGYQFKLYNYGPYDAAVLSDLSQASMFDATESETVYYPSGYGYEYSPGENYEELCQKDKVELAEFDDDIDWVLKEYGDWSASQLELLSTVVFAEREMQRKQKSAPKTDLCQRVKGIKPHFDEDTIAAMIDSLAGQKLIEVIAA